jgi:hypothetical protein
MVGLDATEVDFLFFLFYIFIRFYLFICICASTQGRIQGGDDGMHPPPHQPKTGVWLAGVKQSSRIFKCKIALLTTIYNARKCIFCDPKFQNFLSIMFSISSQQIDDFISLEDTLLKSHVCLG